MTFVNKKETVIQIELTPFGKRKLAKGNFKPDHYRFFDDDIVYDNEYTGTADGLNKAQDRIKESIRLEPQYLKTGIETSFDTESELISSGSKDLFEELRQSDNTEKSDKLLSFPLGTMDLVTQDAPGFNLVSWNGTITSTSVTYSDPSNNGFRTPQIEMGLTHKVIRDMSNTHEVDGELYDSESFQVDLTADEVEFLDGSKLIRKREEEALLISLEETNVGYLKENFDVEIFEVIPPVEGDPDSTETLVKLREAEKVLKYFDIKTDDSIEEIPKRNKVNKNFFSN